MNPVRVIFVESEIGEKKGMFNHTSVSGELLAQDVEGCINDMHARNSIFLRMEPVMGTRTIKGVSAMTTIGYLLFFEERDPGSGLV
jgi:hypothetical protein